MKKTRIVIFIAFILTSYQIAHAWTMQRPEEMRPRDRYQVEAALRVQKNWEFNSDLVENEKIAVSIEFKILPDGKVKDFEIIKHSGNKHLDASASDAIIKSIPFDPFPPEISDPYIEMKLRFTPRGL